ncbi:MAG: hypothetical protein IT179_06970 [Acidobacteria bacterium]|nr:hypothetical protein [Acidobacteriota bacterium]
MMRTFSKAGVPLAAAVLMAACSGTPGTPTSPSAAAGGAATAAADGSTLKVSAPVPLAPENGTRTDTLAPVLAWQNSTGRFAGGLDLTYELEVSSGGTVLFATTVPSGGGSTQFTPPDGEYDTGYTWRVRARLEGAAGPWSQAFSFSTPEQPTAGGPVGPPRNIGVSEAVDIIYAIYQAGRYDIGTRSTREQRNRYLEIAVAALHYGHGKWNPRGPDPNWCIKNGGPGRPQADDVIVRCDTRDAWDLVLSIGGPSPIWHTDYIGRLPGIQAVYPPSVNALGLLPQ